MLIHRLSFEFSISVRSNSWRIIRGAVFTLIKPMAQNQPLAAGRGVGDIELHKAQLLLLSASNSLPCQKERLVRSIAIWVRITERDGIGARHAEDRGFRQVCAALNSDKTFPQGIAVSDAQDALHQERTLVVQRIVRIGRVITIGSLHNNGPRSVISSVDKNLKLLRSIFFDRIASLGSDGDGIALRSLKLQSFFTPAILRNIRHKGTISSDDIVLVSALHFQVTIAARRQHDQLGSRPSHSSRQHHGQRQQAKQFEFLTQPEFLLPNLNPSCAIWAPVSALLRRMHSHLQRAPALFSQRQQKNAADKTCCFLSSLPIGRPRPRPTTAQCNVPLPTALEKTAAPPFG
ncbi:hypothetical protein [uncultured Fretibacterium sp.]|uniref:hypothetical protein n=1 Tax=uncultured Fretibacterium sp. TaxID=1678694 RepID=UPI0026156097|nr:hypothetical protein [uncultured Fretibacterium sp.]